MTDKYCTDCGEPRLNDHKFCGKCGKAHNDSRKRVKKAFIVNQDDVNAYNYHQDYLKKTNSLSFYIIALVITLSVTILGLLEYIGFAGNDYYVMRISIFLIIVCGVFFSGLHAKAAHFIINKSYPHGDKSMKQVYYTLFSSQDENGKSQCIYCGGKRFFKKGIYASHHVTMNCTSCQNQLYRDHD